MERRPARERDPAGPDSGERAADADEVGHRAEHRAQNCSQDGCAKGGSERLAPTLAGDSTVSHASAPAQVIVLAAPWRNRARPSDHGSPASAKAKLATDEHDEADEDGALGPDAERRQPPGTPPKRAPAPKAATSSPALALESPNSSA